MYIAFKWLFFLAFNMWLGMCIFDLFIKENIKRSFKDADSGQFKLIFKNTSVHTENNLATRGTVDYSYNDKGQSMVCLHCIMFLAGALAVMMYHKKQEIVTFTLEKITKMSVKDFVIKRPHLKNTAIILSAAISKYLPCFLEKIKTFLCQVTSYMNYLIITDQNLKDNTHISLIQKLKEMRDERKCLGQLLISALHENKNIKVRYQLETMTKNRLMQHIECNQKQMKENRSRYVSFQQLYIVTNQENIFLKARLDKLKQEKDEAEKNLMNLIHEIYKSKNKELTAYCTRFIVKTKDKLFNLDANAEIQEYLDKTTGVTQSANYSKQSELILPKGWATGSTRITEIFDDDDCLVPLASDEPRLKGLPGEYVWTVKDKNGIIEKLYEYDYESDLDNGDTIKRIRQYSVYYDKDCLLDFSKMQREENTETSSIHGQSLIISNPSSNQRFLTGSQAFKDFLHNNKSIVPIKPPAPSLLCG